MSISREEIIESFIPNAVLVPLTQEAKNSVSHLKLQSNLIMLNEFPFKVGRESRIDKNEQGFFVKFRLDTNTAQLNDIYLADLNPQLQISRTHFLISKNNGKYFIKDRESTLGTKVNGEEIGKQSTGIDFILNHDDIIQVGNDHSKYQYQFVVLK